MLSLKRRNKNIRRCLVLALGFVCSISLSGCSFGESVDVREHYGKYVSANESVDLFIKEEDDYKKVASAQANVVLALDEEEQQDMGIPYFKLADMDVYVDAYKVKKTESVATEDDFIPYVAFNENIQTKSDFTLYNENEEPVYQIDDAQNYPIYIKEDQKYGIKIENHLFYVHEDEVDQILASENANEELAKEIPVLMYHFFYDKNDPPKNIDGNDLEKEAFKEHLEYIKKENYTVLRMVDVERFLDKKVQVPRKSLAITMDDGQDNQAEIAAPLLKEYGFHSTAFLITDWYPEGTLPEYWLQAKTMGMETQSHSDGLHTGGCDEQHGGKMLCVDYDAGVQDIKKSMAMTDAFVFCYPFGDFNDRSKKMLQEAGIHMAFTTQFGTVEPGMDKLELPRVRIHGDASIERFASSITY